jgi:4-diphosphocytidyl-2-C-methyl-D-erythritol kinase
MTSVLVLTPAKINLGLEIIRRREDGYHEIATILQSVSVFDRLVFRPATELSLSLTAQNRSIHHNTVIDELGSEQNLVMAAAQLLRERLGLHVGAAIELRKRIPVAAGLGGASSDAAACLQALCTLWGVNSPSAFLAQLAAELGSDVAFFISGGTALATGRGEVLTRLPNPCFSWYVIATPVRHLGQKTAVLYSMLRPEDFSSGNRIEHLAAAIRRGLPPDPWLLGNAFSRTVAQVFPETNALQAALLEAGAPFVALSGAGPAHYTAVDSINRAVAIGVATHSRLGAGYRVLVCRAARGVLMRRAGGAA